MTWACWIASPPCVADIMNKGCATIQHDAFTFGAFSVAIVCPVHWPHSVVSKVLKHRFCNLCIPYQQKPLHRLRRTLYLRVSDTPSSPSFLTRDGISLGTLKYSPRASISSWLRLAVAGMPSHVSLLSLFSMDMRYEKHWDRSSSPMHWRMATYTSEASLLVAITLTQKKWPSHVRICVTCEQRNTPIKAAQH